MIHDPAPGLAPESPPLLRVEGLSCAFDTGNGWKRAVDDVSFTLGAGQTLGIVGESGSGKSMLTRALLGLAPASAAVTGRVSFDSVEISALPPRQLRELLGRRIAVVFQDAMSALNPVLRIGRQLMEPLRLRKGLGRAVARRRAVELLEQVGIPDPVQKLRQYPHQLSGGMRQRVTIAAALACEPDLLIADEATTALDVTVQRQILDLLSGVQAQRRMAMILISHDLGVIAGRTDEVAVMYAGQIVERAPTPVFFTRHRHRYSAALVGSVISPDHPQHGKFRSIPGAPPSIGEYPSCCPFAPRCDAAGEECRTARPPEVAEVDVAVHVYRCFHPLGATAVAGDHLGVT